MQKPILILSTMLLGAALAANAADYYCSPQGAGNGDGSSWDNALAAQTLSAVFDIAAAGDNIYLTAGTYYTGAQLKPAVGLTVVGGFPAEAVGTDLSAYDPWTNKTIFDAQGQNGTTACIKVSGSVETIATKTTFKGLTITGATGSSTSTYAGTAFNCTYANVLMEDVTFYGNSSYQGGCVVPASGSRFHAKHCVWNDNHNIRTSAASSLQCVLNGRGESKDDGSGVTYIVLEGCVMVNNSIADETARAGATYGGAMSMQDQLVCLAMVNCYADGGGHAISQNGGFLRMGNATSTTDVTRSFFAFNTICNFKTAHATEAKGHLISFNGYAPFYLQGNLFITDTAPTASDEKANNAIFIQGWNSKDMSGIVSGGHNSITGSYFATYAANNCTIREQQATDLWLAPVMSEVFGSNTTVEKNGRFYLEPLQAYCDVNLEEALTAYNSYEMPECFAWANVDLSLDLFGNKRAATTYRGAYDPNAVEATNAIADVAADANAPCEYYNLQGIRVAEPASGIYILRQGNRATKILR